MRRRERGAVLLLVLAAVALLAALAVEMASRASAESLRASRSSRDAAFRRLFDSGAEVARGLLAEPEPTAFTSWAQPWNREVHFTLAQGEDMILRLEDESGKLNVARATLKPEETAAVKDALRRLIGYLVRHDSGRPWKWRDVGEKVLRRLSSREPLLSLDGLRETDLEPLTVFGSDGLSRYLTAFGDGRINLNTAPRAVLASLDPEFDDGMVDRIAGYRGKGEGEPGVYKPFETPQDLMLVEGIVNRSVGADGRLRVDRNLYEKVQGLVTTKSSCFSARIHATVGGRGRDGWAFFKPDGTRLALEEVLP